MLYQYISILGVLFLCQLPLVAQQTDAEGFEFFEYDDGDTTFTMKKYYLCLLKRGDRRDQSKEEVAEIQKNHLAHLKHMADQGKICVSGPFAEDGEWRGIVIYNVTTSEEADSLAKADPAVQAGRLTVEIHPWWGAKGASLK